MSLRVAYVSADPGVPVFGHKGCSVHVQEILRALLRRPDVSGVDLYTARTGGPAPADLSRVTVHALPPLPKGDFAPREQAALANNVRVREMLEADGPFDLLYERYSLWSHAPIEYAAAHAIPGMLEVNAPLIEEQATHRGLADRAGAEAVAARVFSAASGVIAVSEEVRQNVIARGGDRRRVHVIPNGVDPSRFPDDLKPDRPAPPGVFTVGFVGMMRPWHGLPVLLDAVARLRRVDPHVRLLVVGDGPEREGIEAEASRHRLTGAIEITGVVARDAVPGLLASMDAATAPYADAGQFYFSPLKVYEYMAAGRAIAASRVGQLAGVIQDGVTGLLCEPGNPAALADALDRLRRDPPLRDRLGSAARHVARERHTWDAVVGRILHLSAGARTSDSAPIVGVAPAPDAVQDVLTETGGSCHVRT